MRAFAMSGQAPRGYRGQPAKRLQDSGYRTPTTSFSTAPVGRLQDEKRTRGGVAGAGRGHQGLVALIRRFSPNRSPSSATSQRGYRRQTSR